MPEKTSDETGKELPQTLLSSTNLAAWIRKSRAHVNNLRAEGSPTNIEVARFINSTAQQYAGELTLRGEAELIPPEEEHREGGKALFQQLGRTAQIHRM